MIVEVCWKLEAACWTNNSGGESGRKSIPVTRVKTNTELTPLDVYVFCSYNDISRVRNKFREVQL